MVRELTLVDDIARTIDPDAFVIWRDKHGDEVAPSSTKSYRQAKAICTAAQVIKQLSYMTPDALLEALEDDEIARMQDVVKNVAKEAEAKFRAKRLANYSETDDDEDEDAVKTWDDITLDQDREDEETLRKLHQRARQADAVEVTNKTSAAHAAAMGTPINAAEK